MEILKLDTLNDLKLGESIYLAPNGGAVKKFIKILKKYRPDINIINILDSFYSDFIQGGSVKKISQLCDDKKDEKVIIIIEREKIRKDIASSLQKVGFNKLYWISNSFSVDSNQSKNDKSDVLYFFYDLSVNALNYEFLIALCHADSERRKNNIKVLHAIIVPQREGSIYDLSRQSIKNKKCIQEADNFWFLHNVIVPSIALLRSKNSITLCSTRYEANKLLETVAINKFPEMYDVKHPVEMNSNINILQENDYFDKSYGQPFNSSLSALTFVKQWLRLNNVTEYNKLVVITLRQNGLQESRNSDLSTWKSVASSLKNDGYTPIYVKDTYSDFEKDELNNCLIFHEASWNILLRMAIYEIAFLNLTVNTGTSVLCMFNRNVNYLEFMYLSEHSNEYVGSPEFYRASGVPVGSQYPAFTEFQRWVWGGTHNCEKIISEFDEMSFLINNASNS